MEILKISPKNFKKLLPKLINTIKEAKILVCPTDTVYGLISDATSQKAVKKIFQIKKRKIQKSLPIFVKDIKMAKEIAEISKKQENFLKKVWPGKVTVILKRKGRRKLYGVNKKTIALRIPKYKLINILLQKLNQPLTATSANISNFPASTKIEEVIAQLKNKKHQPDFIIDAGNLKKSRPSIIIDLTFPEPKILRI